MIMGDLDLGGGMDGGGWVEEEGCAGILSVSRG